jgi:hypothetical protein
MPNMAYLSQNRDVPSGEDFIMNGGWSFNRYHSAYARKQIGKSVVHRLHGDGGHSLAPDGLMQDGMVWIEGRLSVEQRGGEMYYLHRAAD